jgi:hypothetical protein
MGPRAGQGVLRFGDRVDMDHLPPTPIPRCVAIDGVSLHAGVAVPARDRSRLERLCRYVARPPLATERLSRLDDGRLLYELRHRWRDGTTHVAFEPLELLERLAALVPYPRFNMVRYHGVLAPAARYRSQVVPSAPASDPVAEEPADDAAASAGSVPTAVVRSRNYSWAELMHRVFEIDVLECPECRGRMRILAAIHPPHATRAILECLGLSSRAPPVLAAAGTSFDPWDPA